MGDDKDIEKIAELESELRRLKVESGHARVVAVMAVLVGVVCISANFFAISNLAKFDQQAWNPISFSLAMLQTLLAIIALGGFWLVRGAAISSAKDEAEKVTIKAVNEKTEGIVSDVLDKDNFLKNFLKDTVVEYLNSKDGKGLVRGVVLLETELKPLISGKPNASGLPGMQASQEELTANKKAVLAKWIKELLDDPPG